MKKRNIIAIHLFCVVFCLPAALSAVDSPETVIQCGHAGRVVALDFHPEGRYLASSGGGTVKIWSPDGEIIRTFRVGYSGAHNVKFSPNGDYLVFDSGGLAVELRAITGELIHSVSGHGGFTFTPDGKRLVTWGANLPWFSDKSLKKTGINIWSLNGELLRTIEMQGHVVNNVALSPDGMFLAADSGKDTVQLWTLSGDLVRSFDIPRGSPFRFSHDSVYLAVSEATMFSSTISLWKLDGEPVARIEGHDQLVFSPDSRNMITYGSQMDTSIKLWSLTGKLLHTFSGHERAITDAFFSSDGEYLISSSMDKTIRLWSSSGGIIRSYDHDGEVECMSVSSDNRYLAGAGRLGSIFDGYVNLWAFDGELIASIKNTDPEIAEVSFSPDGGYIAAGIWSNGVHLWSVKDGLKWTEDGPDLQCYCPTSVSFSSDGRSLAARYYPEKYYWSVPGGRPFTGGFTENDDLRLHTLAASPNTYGPAVVSPDGKETVTIYQDGSEFIVTFRNTDGKVIRSFQLNNTPQGHLTPWPCVAFSPDWKYLASSAWDNIIRLWTPEGELVRTFEGHTKGMYGLAFSPDGKYLASGSLDHSIRIWNIDTGDWVELTVLSESDWFVYHPSGRFYCAEGGKAYIRFVEGMNIYPAEMYWDSFFTPGLIEKFMQGDDLWEIELP